MRRHRGRSSGATLVALAAALDLSPACAAGGSDAASFLQAAQGSAGTWQKYEVFQGQGMWDFSDEVEVGPIPKPVKGGAPLYDDVYLHVGESPILVVTLLVLDGGGTFSRDKHGLYPLWLSKLLWNNLARVKRNGHSYLMRTRVTIREPRGQMASCEAKKRDGKLRENTRNNTEQNQKAIESCRLANKRVNVNYEKFKLVRDYLTHERHNYSHVLFLDVDTMLANNATSPNDSVTKMARRLDAFNGSAFFANEDYTLSFVPNVSINGGVQMWRDTAYAKALLQGLVDAHLRTFEDLPKNRQGWYCQDSDQCCVRDVLKYRRISNRVLGFDSRPGEDLLVESGRKWNAHPCILVDDCPPQHMAPHSSKEWRRGAPGIEILHFMGRAKTAVRLVDP